MKLSFVCLAIFLFSTAAVCAQDNQAEKGYVLYDPLFWKSQLKLNAEQCQKIREINSQFYEKLSAVAHEETNHKALRQKAVQTLLERSEEIWETFYPKQRKIWKKMWEDSPGAPQAI